MIIECKDHAPEVIQQWMEEDILEIDEMHKHKNWLEGAISRNSMDEGMRDPLQDHLEDINTNIKQLKEELRINYAQTYNILHEEIKRKIGIQRGSPRATATDPTRTEPQDLGNPQG